MKKINTTKPLAGFTIVELLIVIVVIAVLATIVTVAYNGVRTSAQQAKISSDLTSLQKAIMVARQTSGKTSLGVAPPNPGCGGGGAGTCCLNYGAWSTPPANCMAAYNNFLDKVSTASGIDVRGMTDPWGNPYMVIQFERVGDCRNDELFALKPPVIGWGTARLNYIELPLSDASGCTE